MTAAHKFENPLLDKTTVKAFIHAVQKTLFDMACTEIHVGKPFIESHLTPRGEVIGILGMVAPPLRGTLSLSFPANTILKIVKNMLGETYTEIDKNSTDAVGELTNMIYGSAKAALNDSGFNLEMAIPTVFHGQFQSVTNVDGVTLIIPIKLSSSEEFFIGITVNQ